jgi:hypothetical protein
MSRSTCTPCIGKAEWNALARRKPCIKTPVARTGAGAHLQVIDFRLEDHGRSVHDLLVRAWWNDTGFAGRCPNCRQWIHFTIRGKRAIGDAEAAALPQLPDDWGKKATVL